MIFLPVEEAFAFDYLSILEVKMENGIDTIREVAEVKEVLRSHLYARVNLILMSNEYKALVEANRFVWKLVELAKNDECTAKAVDMANQERFIAKQRLQEKFFGQLKEQKSARN